MQQTQEEIQPFDSPVSPSRTVDLSLWERREHYEFFSQAADPYFGITAEIRCEGAFKLAAESHLPVFSVYLHAVMKAVNAVEALRTRAVDGKILIYETLHCAPALPRENAPFSFSFVPWQEDLLLFHQDLQREKARVASRPGLGHREENERRHDLIHYSTLPWLRHTQIKHPWFGPGLDSIPKVVAGRIFSTAEGRRFPVSLHAHHGLADGWHAGEFYRILEQLIG